METRETRGARIARLRKARNWSLEELGDKVGATKAAVSKWEKGASPNIDLEVFFKLADAFSIDPRELAIGEKSPSPSISPARLDLIRMYGRLPTEVRTPIRMLITSLAAAQSDRYAAWSKAEGERAKKRDEKSKDEA